MRELGRYLLWQLPGWVLAGLLVLWLTALVALPGWAAAALLAAVILKDLGLFPLLRGAFVDAGRSPLLGARGQAVEPLTPVGYVKVGGELWRARARGGPIPAGAPVVVRESRGLTLIVDAVR